MNKTLLSTLLLTAFVVQPLMAQDLVPATSEDLKEFDRQVAKQAKPKDAAAKGSNFGALVSEEARKLKDAGDDQGSDFGKWVSGQRKKSDQGQAGAAASVGSGNSSHANSVDNSNRGKKPNSKK
jgi:hypothetical protein